MNWAIEMIWSLSLTYWSIFCMDHYHGSTAPSYGKVPFSKWNKVPQLRICARHFLLSLHNSWSTPIHYHSQRMLRLFFSFLTTLAWRLTASVELSSYHSPKNALSLNATSIVLRRAWPCFSLNSSHGRHFLSCVILYTVLSFSIARTTFPLISVLVFLPGTLLGPCAGSPYIYTMTSPVLVP